MDSCFRDYLFLYESVHDESMKSNRPILGSRRSARCDEVPAVCRGSGNRHRSKPAAGHVRDVTRIGGGGRLYATAFHRPCGEREGFHVPGK